MQQATTASDNYWLLADWVPFAKAVVRDVIQLHHPVEMRRNRRPTVEAEGHIMQVAGLPMPRGRWERCELLLDGPLLDSPRMKTAPTVQ